jgi:miniconductance mechanosensitive channel
MTATLPTIASITFQQTTPAVQGVGEWIAAHPVAGTIAFLGVLLVVALLADLVSRRILLGTVNRVVERTVFTWDDVLKQHRVFRRLAHLAPLLVVRYGLDLVPGVPDAVVHAVQVVADLGIVLLLLFVVHSLLGAASQIYEEFPVSRTRPIRGYVQVVQIVVWILGGILLVALLTGRDPLLLLSGFGALAAVLTLVFKDTLLSLVASVQIAGNDMLRVGDWIEMPQLGADGEVVEILLHTVKVQNWDKTVTTVPTYKLVSESFKNWRFMSESGGRRIKRALNLDQGTIRFLTPDEIERFRSFRLLSGYMERKARELEEANRTLGTDADRDPNARRLTNVGTFRAYVAEYLRNHPRLNRGMTLMVRQLEPGPDGLPLQVYCFTATTKWAEYEAIQSDIFDHLLATVPEFGLRVFQHPSGEDLRHVRVGAAEDR